MCEVQSIVRIKWFYLTNVIAKNIEVNTTIADYYFDLLSTLNADSKLDLISLLPQSLRNSNHTDIPLQSLFGSYKSDESADEIIASLRAARSTSVAL